MKALKYIFLFIFLLINIVSTSQENNFVFIGNKTAIVYDICFTKNGHAIAQTENNNIKLFSIKDNKLLMEFKNGHDNDVLTIDISNDSTLLVSGGRDSTIVIWDLCSGEIINKLKYHTGVSTTVDISPNNMFLVSGSSDNKVYIYDFEKEDIFRLNNEHTDDITSVCFNQESSLIASSSADKTIKLYDINEGKTIKTLTRHSNWVRDVSFCSTGKRLVSCDDSGTMIIWSIDDFKNIRIIDKKRYGVSWLLGSQFSDDCNSIVLGNSSGKLWIKSYSSTYTAKIGKMINNVKFRPTPNNHLTVAVATRGAGVILIDAQDMEIIKY